MISRILSVVLGTVSFVALASPSHAEWVEAKSKHFTVYGNMKSSDLQSRTRQLEKFDALLRSIFNIKTDDMATIYYVASMGEVEKLARSRNVAGFYRADAQSAVAVIPEKMPNMPNFMGSSLSPERIMYHEYVHHMLLSNSGKFFPAWATEGLAELFATAKFSSNGDVIIGAPNVSRLDAIASQSRWSVRKLLENGTFSPGGDERIELYSRGWALCHYLLISGKRPGQFFKYVDAINSGVAPLKAGEDVFGNLEQLDRELERYIRQATFPSALFTADKIKVPTDIAARSLTPGEAAIFPYRLVSAIGVDDKSGPVLAQRASPVGAQFPSDEFVQRTMAEIEYDARNYDNANVAADRALALDPNDVMAMIYKGRIAMRRALANKNDPALVREARRWFLAANKQNPEFALPFATYYDSFVAVGQIPPASAVTGISRAAYLVPSDFSLRVRVGVAAVRAGDIKLARFTLAPMALNPHTSADNPVVKFVKAIDGGANQAALLKKATELKLDRINEFSQPESDTDKKSKDGETPKA